MLKKGITLLWIAMLLLLSWTCVVPADPAYAATGIVYYVDSASGKDTNNGTSQNTPWKTLASVSSRASQFKPGDQILLKSGSIWNESFDITFSGAEGSAITVGKYGGDTKPVINGRGGNYAVRIQNQQHITVRDIEITNFSASNYDDYKSAYYRRSGVWVQAYHKGAMSNISLIGLDIHDITGISVTGESWVKDTDGDMVNKNHNAAILLNSWEWEANVAADKHAYFKNLLVQDCSIHDIRTIGITLDGHEKQTETLYHKNVVIKNNTISKTGSDAIVIGVSENPLIEYNTAYDAGIHSVDGKWIAGIWVWRTLGATIQNNEVARVHYQSSASADSNAFDVDIQAQGNHLFQYNYSHDNTGGFAMDMGQLKNGRTVYRYNISQNDQHHSFSGNTMNISDPSLLYNNLFYNDNGDGFVIANNAKATFVNNIFYTSKGNTPYPAGPKFYNNGFFGAAPPAQGLNNLTVDPKFVNPGQGGDGMASVAGYRLQPDSPLIGAGRAMEEHGGKDFWGNALYTGSPDIGVFEAPDSTVSDSTAPARPTGLTVIDRTDTSVTLAWNAMENGVPLDGEIYNAADQSKAASVMFGNRVTVTGLAPDTAYSFYAVAKDRSGNPSAGSDPVTVRTSMAAVAVDNTDAQITGSWNAANGGSSYNNDYLTIAKGSGANSVTWTPSLARDGYYQVYYRLPAGNGNRASNAPFTVSFDGSSKTYLINERTATGEWTPLGIHRFKAGTSGSVKVTDLANGEIAADAVKFLYLEGFGPSSISRAILTAEKQQLRVGTSMSLSVVGTDESGGKALDLVSAGFPIQYESDNPAVTVSSSGIVTAVTQGTAQIKATAVLNGASVVSNTVRVIAGPAFTVLPPAITDGSGQPIASLTPYGLVQASTTVVNSTDNQQSATLILAVYNQDGLLKSSSADAAVKSYDSSTLTTTLVLPGDVAGCYVRAFVWDGKESMHPLAPRTGYPN
ncbi:golvesin C-terminal-like domain-containing protein [Gorillibacterium sp. sgz5001074]|uniref:golvesin C-terminal-like domain-containing protein n=1 Tax=Gorillibacterium sp. sgz5001074 TaxID=3446695 RepID=UPI003F662F5C